MQQTIYPFINFFKSRVNLTSILVLTFLLAGSIDSYLSPMQASSGIAVGFVLLFGFRRSALGIIIGSLAASWQKDAHLNLALVEMMIHLIEAGLGGKLLMMVLGREKFEFKGLRDIWMFIILSVGLAPAFSSTLAAVSLLMTSHTPWPSLPYIWFTYFMGNSLGILVFSPFVVSLFKSRKRFKVPFMTYLEGVSFVIIAAIVCEWSFENAKEFLAYPFIIWASLRFRYFGVSVATLIISSLAIRISTSGTHLFHTGSLELDILWIQGFVSICSISGYLLATVIETEKKALEKELESERNLQHKILAEESLGILDQVIQKSPVGFALIDKSFRYMKINESFSLVNGRSVEDHLGKTIREMIPDIALYVEEVVREVFQTGQSILSVPIKGHLRADPFTETSGLISYYPVRQPGKMEILGVAISFEDQTNQHRVEKMLRENQSRLNFAQEAGRIGIFEWRFDTAEIHWTPQLEAIYGLERGEFEGCFEHWIKFIHPDDLQRVKKSMKTVYKESIDLGIQFRIIKKDGAVRWILSRGGVIRDPYGNTIGFSGINVDVTEQKSIEERLRKAEGELLEALAARDEFFAIASHELKTPLTSLKLQIQLHQRALSKEDPTALLKEKVSLLLSRNYQQLERLNRLVDDMLDISRIRTGRLTLKKDHCEISQIVTDILSRSREQFLASGSGEPIIHVMEKAHGHWDSMRIEQVISNVINNAIRYGNGNPISLSVKNAKGSVIVSVQDHGLGIAPEDEKRIFHRFERGYLTREVSGLGLGLYISKQIMDAHKGNISVESKLGQGTTFHIELPVLPSPADLNLPYQEISEGNYHQTTQEVSYLHTSP